MKNGKIFVFCGFEPQNILYLWGFAGIKLLFSMTEYTKKTFLILRLQPLGQAHALMSVEVELRILLRFQSVDLFFAVSYSKHIFLE